MQMRVFDIGPSPSRTRLVSRLYKIRTMILLHDICIICVQKRLDVVIKKFGYSNKINIFHFMIIYTIIITEAKNEWKYYAKALDKI